MPSLSEQPCSTAQQPGPCNPKRCFFRLKRNKQARTKRQKSVFWSKRSPMSYSLGSSNIGRSHNRVVPNALEASRQAGQAALQASYYTYIQFITSSIQEEQRGKGKEKERDKETESNKANTEATGRRSRVDESVSPWKEKVCAGGRETPFQQGTVCFWSKTKG